METFSDKRIKIKSSIQEMYYLLENLEKTLETRGISM